MKTLSTHRAVYLRTHDGEMEIGVGKPSHSPGGM